MNRMMAGRLLSVMRSSSSSGDTSSSGVEGEGGVEEPEATPCSNKGTVSPERRRRMAVLMLSWARVMIPPPNTTVG